MTARRLTRRQFAIITCWDLHEDINPDISTEQLLARVKDDTGAEADEVIGAIDAAARTGAKK